MKYKSFYVINSNTHFPIGIDHNNRYLTFFVQLNKLYNIFQYRYLGFLNI